MVPRHPSVRRPPSPSAVAALAAVVVSTAILLAGCSAPEGGRASDHDGGGVATLQTSRPTASASSATDALHAKYGATVRLRIDISDADSDRAYQGFNDCVADHTPKNLTSADPDGSGMGAASPEQTEADDAAQALCRPLEPLPPWEYDRNNPDARRFVEAVIDCLATKGVPGATVADDDGSGRVSVAFTGDSGKALAVYPECERQASRSGK